MGKSKVDDSRSHHPADLAQTRPCRDKYSDSTNDCAAASLSRSKCMICRRQNLEKGKIAILLEVLHIIMAVVSGLRGISVV
jgi:hypothetical protein